MSSSVKNCARKVCSLSAAVLLLAAAFPAVTAITGCTERQIRRYEGLDSPSDNGDGSSQEKGARDAGPEPQYAGTYHNPDGDIIIRADGTYRAQNDDGYHDGTWSVKGTRIFFVGNNGSKGTGHIKDGVISNSYGTFSKE